MAGPTKELINPVGTITKMLEDEWDGYNTLEAGTADERDISIPDPIIEKERPPTGSSSRSLPRSIRARPCAFVWETSAGSREKGDTTGHTEDWDAVVRVQIVVADGKNGRDGAGTRNDLIWVIDRIRQANYSPPGGIAGSRWSNLHPGEVDKTPTEYSEQWRANIDMNLMAHKVTTEI